MTKKGYTELEIELYEKLAEIKGLTDGLGEQLFNFYGESRGKQNIKKLAEIFRKKNDISYILKKLKIPKKFLILNALGDKK